MRSVQNSLSAVLIGRLIPCALAGIDRELMQPTDHVRGLCFREDDDAGYLVDGEMPSTEHPRTLARGDVLEDVVEGSPPRDWRIRASESTRTALTPLVGWGSPQDC